MALWILVALAVLTPWAFGGVTPAAVRLLCGVSLAAATAIAAYQGGRGTVWLPGIRAWPLVLIFALALFQLLPLPGGLHALIAPGSAAVWHPSEPTAATLLGGVARPLSISPTRTRTWLALTGGLVGLTLLAAPTLRRHRMATRVAWVLVLAGATLAVYAVVARTVFGPLLYGRIEVPTVAPFGPFVNKNHFAGYVAMTAMVALGLGRGLARQAAGASAVGSSSSTSALIAFAAAATMAMAVLLSLSRGGVLGLIAGMGSFAALDVAGSRTASRRRVVPIVAGAAALLLGLVALLPEDVHQRLVSLRWRADASATFRLGVWQDAARAWASSPVFGHGLGAFEETLPRFKTAAGQYRVEHPENEPLELAVEGGLVALAGAIAGLAGALARGARAIHGHHDRVLRGIVDGAMAGVVALSIHGLVDFNLRIPSNAILFLVLLALVLGPVEAARWRGPLRWLFPAAIALAAAPYLLATRDDAAARLRDARLAAARAQAIPDAAAARLRVQTSQAAAREYLRRRPADPEGWLLAAWAAHASGDAVGAAALARHATTLDPQRAAVLSAARALAPTTPDP